MKKEVIIALLTIVSIASISFGIYQKTRADRNETAVIESERIIAERVAREQELLNRAHAAEVMVVKEQKLLKAEAAEVSHLRLVLKKNETK